MIIKKKGRYNQEIIEFQSKQDFDAYRAEQNSSFFVIFGYIAIISFAIIGFGNVLCYLFDKYAKYLQEKRWK